MSDPEPDPRELIRRFVAQRYELGDGFWPTASERPETPSLHRESAPVQPEAVAERPDEHYRVHPSGKSPSSRPDVSKPPSPSRARPLEASDRGIVAPAPQASLLGSQADTGAWEGLTLAEFEQAIRDCRRCPLWETRTNFVFGEGDPNADLMFIGEAPGEEEDRQGRPFVGRAGQLLARMLEAMKLRREDVYIGNVLKSRPPNNRSPVLSEMEACMPYLEHQIRLIKPKIICALGRVAAQMLLQTNESLTRLRGKWHDYQGIKLFVTYHPAALLRNPHLKRDSWEDLKKLRRELDGVEL